MESNKNFQSTASKEAAIKAAHKALQQTNQAFPFGSGNVSTKIIDKTPASDKIIVTPFLFSSLDANRRRNLEALINEKLIDLATKKINQVRSIAIEIKNAINNQHISLEEKKHLLFRLRFVLAEKAAEVGAGNCGELTPYAFLQLVFSDYPGKIEYVAFKGGEHEFIVLNRSDHSKIDDWKTWTEESVILDPWLNKVYTANEFASIWRDNPWNIPINHLKTKILFNNADYAKEAKASMKKT